MRYAVAVVVAALAGAVGFVVGDRGGDETTTVTVMQTETAADVGVPDAVLEKRGAMLRAAEAQDYEALAELANPEEFTYTFGGPVEGGPAKYWRDLALEGQDPLEVLPQILRMPYTLSSGTFVWPFAYDKTLDTLTDYERELLEPLATSFAGDSYLGWRAGIRPDGRWVFFVAGD